MHPFYFAYGSNMSTARLRARIPTAAPVGAARIDGYRLICNKRGKDGSGKANLVTTPDGEAWGVLFRIEAGDWRALDRYEWGYERRPCRVVATRESCSAQLYLALAPESREIPPFDWYRSHCLDGAREHALPAQVIDEIEHWTVELT